MNFLMHYFFFMKKITQERDIHIFVGKKFQNTFNFHIYLSKYAWFFSVRQNRGRSESVITLIDQAVLPPIQPKTLFVAKWVTKKPEK